jgi:hypothetical protein
MSEDEKGGECSTHRRDEMHITFWSKNLKRIAHLEDLGVGGRLMLERLLKK